MASTDVNPLWWVLIAIVIFIFFVALWFAMRTRRAPHSEIYVQSPR